MYLTLVRPHLELAHLELASQVWKISKFGEIDSLEKVQKYALRVCSKQWNTSYDELLQLFSLPTLQQRRLYLDLSTMFKIPVVHSLSYFLAGIFVGQTPRVTRSQFYCLACTCTFTLFCIVLQK